MTLTFHVLPAPQMPPHNVTVQRLPDGTAMNVSFTRLSLVEARSLNVTYTVRYSHTAFHKRQSTPVEDAVPDQQSYVVIIGLDPHTTYHVVVVVSNSLGNMPSTSHIINSGIYIYHVSTCDGLKSCVSIFDSVSQWRMVEGRAAMQEQWLGSW